MFEAGDQDSNKLYPSITAEHRNGFEGFFSKYLSDLKIKSNTPPELAKDGVEKLGQRYNEMWTEMGFPHPDDASRGYDIKLFLTEPSGYNLTSDPTEKESLCTALQGLITYEGSEPVATDRYTMTTYLVDKAEE